MPTSKLAEEAAYILLTINKHDQKLSPQDKYELALLANQQIHSKKRRLDKNQYSQRMTKKTLEEDDSDGTLIKLLEWKNITPGYEARFKNVAEEISEPIRKQLRNSDIKEDQSRLMLSKLQVKTRMLPLLKPSEGNHISRGTDGLDVSVYGSDGEVQEMKFKMWNVDTPVLTSGWKEFVAKYDLEKHCDFLAISMFRHIETRRICFAIESTRFASITNPVSKRISNAVF